MANISNPVLPFIHALNEPSQHIISDTATSFCTPTDNKEHFVSLYCHQGAEKFQTRFQLIFQTAVEMNQCIAAFLKAGIRPTNVVFCTEIKVGHQDGKTIVDLNLYDKKDFENLHNHFKQLLPEGWVCSRPELVPTPAGTVPNERIAVQLQCNQLLDLNDMESLKKILGKLSFPKPLEQMLNREAAQSIDGQVMSWEQGIDHGRNYRILPDGKLLEELTIPGNYEDYLTPVEALEIEQWLVDPASQKGKGVEKCVQAFKDVFQQSLQNMDGNRIKTLTDAAAYHPPLREAIAQIKFQEG